MVENTSQRSPIEHAAGFLSEASGGNYIENLEAAGQAQFVAEKDTMPALVHPQPDGWDTLQDLGFGAPQPTDDDLFVTTTLPAGWRKEPGDDSRWSYVVDVRGVQRVSVFYKSAFYDRFAFAQVLRVGYELATKDIYMGSTLTQWDVLMDDERRDYITALDQFVADTAEHGRDTHPEVAHARTLRELAAQRLGGA